MKSTSAQASNWDLPNHHATPQPRGRALHVGLALLRGHARNNNNLRSANETKTNKEGEQSTSRADNHCNNTNNTNDTNSQRKNKN